MTLACKANNRTRYTKGKLKFKVNSPEWYKSLLEFLCFDMCWECDAWTHKHYQCAFDDGTFMCEDCCEMYLAECGQAGEVMKCRTKFWFEKIQRTR